MKILHLCSDYAGTPLYRELVESLDEKGIHQIVYIPVRSKNLLEKYRSNCTKNTIYLYSHILNLFHRLDYFTKIKKVFRDITKKISPDSINIVHAHFLFSDGGVAYKLKKEFGIDYVVSVRNTDLNVFFRYLVHLRDYGIKILKNAERIIFLSPAYRELLLNKFISDDARDAIKAKSLVIPNGVNDFWLNNIFEASKKINRNDLSLIYVGEFSRNKNIPTIIRIIEKLNKKGIKANLKLIGQYGNDTDRVKKLVNQRSDYVRSYARTTEKNELLQYYRDGDIFIMPSFHETFGLVYLEAMSQGLPVVYSKEQGLSGYYSDGVIGYSVDPYDEEDILDKLDMIIESYSEISDRCKLEVRKFNWDKIALLYLKAYNYADLKH